MYPTPEASLLKTPAAYTRTELESTQASVAVVSILTVHLDAARSPSILADVIHEVRAEYGSLCGFLSADVLLSVDEKTLAVVSEWNDVHCWAASRYDPRVGELLARCLDNSTALAFEVYYRKSHFAAAPSDIQTRIAAV